MDENAHASQPTALAALADAGRALAASRGSRDDRDHRAAQRVVVRRARRSGDRAVPENSCVGAAEALASLAAIALEQGRASAAEMTRHRQDEALVDVERRDARRARPRSAA